MRKNIIRVSLVVALIFLLSSLSFASDDLYKDGVYIGASDANQRGYVMAIVVIEDGVIADVELTEMNDKAIPKGEDYPWDEWHEAMEVLPEWFIEANSADVDIYTRATTTTIKAKQAVERALDKALVDRPENGKYFEGVFMGRSAADQHGYAVAWVTIEEDQIVDVDLQEVVPPDNEFKDWDTYPHERTVEGRIIMMERFVEAGDADVDIVTGATGSAKKYIEAVEAAMRLAER